MSANNRRSFLRNGLLTGLGAGILPNIGFGNTIETSTLAKGKAARNIIFLVSDGMSFGTMNMADLLLQRKEGRGSRWMELYRKGNINRALMDTASASSMVTDSAAASSSWGGGVRVPNGSLNVDARGEAHQPILQKFKAAGKAVGCVTTVPITHATPAGFCITSKSRGDQSEIASMYLQLQFDVMMGGGQKYFTERKDKKNLFDDFSAKGYQVAKNRSEMLALKPGKPVIAAFQSDALPYSIDREQDAELKSTSPTLAEMLKKGIELMRNSPKGFVLQVEAGKVDWAAHANDTSAILYDQIAFDEAVGVAMDFAMQDKKTLVVITTDHANANPGLFYGKDADKNFERIFSVKQSNDWILNGIKKDYSVANVIERIEFAQGIAVSKEEAAKLLSHYTQLNEEGVYNPYKLPFKELAQIQTKYTSVGWAGMDHSADFVELGMFGPGSELLPNFVKNIDLHNMLLKAAGVKS